MRGAAALALGLLLAGTGREAAAQDPEERFQLSGWSLLSVENGFTRDGFHEDAPDPLEVPHDRLVARGQLHLRERYARGKSFEAVVSGFLSYGLFEQDAPLSDAWLLVNGQAASGRFEADLREAYVGFYSKRLDFRVGSQRVAWGNADAFTPNDVVNPRDIRDPVLSETELRHLPTFLMRADVPLGFGTLQVVAVPFFRTDRYDVYGPNWSFVQIGAPPGYRGLLTTLTQGAGLPPDAAGSLILPSRGAPEDDFSGFAGGVRLDWKLGRVDLTQYYHQGFHGTPDFQVDPALTAVLDATDWSAVTPDQVRALLAGADASGAVQNEWRRRHHFGLGVVSPAGPVLLRLDAAYENQGLFYDRQLNGFRSPVFQGVLGVEVTLGGAGGTLLFELFHQRLADAPPAIGLLYTERSTTALSVLARRTWHERFELEARAVGGVSPGWYLVRPQFSWKWNATALRVGVDLLGGDDLAYGGWFGRNRSVYVMLKRSF